MGSSPAWVKSARKYWVRSFIHFVIYLSFFCSKTGAISRSSNETDRLALLAFKAKITRDPFGVMTLWNDSTHLCEWYGVVCNIRHQRVAELHLFSLNLGGSISPHIGNLSFLRILHLQNNSFIQQIPLQIGRLRRLQRLNLYNNSLSGEIPLTLSNCSELKGLNLLRNKLEGEIPAELGSLSKLQIFGASENNLSGALPPSLGNLTCLEKMAVVNNNLVGRIPITFGSLSHLTFLSLSQNHFNGEVPSSIFNLTNLQIVEIDTNQLEGNLPPNLFQTLPNLQVISTFDNKFTGPIPISLSNASNLQVLELATNKFTGKVPSVTSLTMLIYFLIYENQLGGGVKSQDDLSLLCSLTNATTLEELEMDTNNFGGMLPVCITNLSSQLTHFSINSNYIYGSIPQGIDNLKGLQVLSFFNNSFTGTIPSTIGNMENLVALYLSDNNLSGSIPSSLGNMSKLSELYLRSNRLEGTIPSSLRNCTLLQILFLGQNNLIGSIPPQLLTIPSLSIILSVSQNQLTGPLPEEVAKLTNLYELDVSKNMLSGKIPDNLGECTDLQFLYLNGNNFQGHIPSSLSSLKGLRVLDLSSNNISGQIPEFLASLIWLNLSFNDLEGVVPTKGVFANASATSLEGNSKLCGGIPNFHLPGCISSPTSKKRKMSVKSKITIATVAGLACAAVLILLLYVFGLRRKQRQIPKELVVAASINAPFHFVSYGDLHRATNSFSDENLVGTGSFGNVYRGILGEVERVVAIKVLSLKHHGASRSFVAECEAMRNIRHRNLVKLLTVCSGVDYQGNEFKALVYEFMPNGSLEDWLHPPATREVEVLHQQTPQRRLGFFQRLTIAIDVASLLEYVHHQFGAPLVHCDIKPSNILLDNDLSGHVSDFGLAKFLLDTGIIHSSAHPSSLVGVRGTIGYAPPEYGLGCEVATKGDVYSYGILLLEMFTGKRPTDEMFKDSFSIHLFAKMALPSGVVDILDHTLLNILETEDQVFNPRRSMRAMNCLISLIEIGVACSIESPTQRMDMSMVVAKLQKIKDTLLKGNN